MVTAYFITCLMVFSCASVVSPEFYYGAFPANFQWGYATGKPIFFYFKFFMEQLLDILQNLRFLKTSTASYQIEGAWNADGK